MADEWKINESDFIKQETPEKRILFILKYAILAPSTHNSQPWLFKIKNSSVEIYIDESRRLPQADPSGRDVYVSIGCMLENLIIAARYFGIYERHIYHLKGNFAAEVFFKSSDNTQQTVRNMGQYALFNVIAKRINARGLFEDKPIDKAILDFIDTLRKNVQSEIPLPTDIRTDFITDKGKIKQLAELTAQGLKIAHSSPIFRKEISRWLISNFSKRKTGLPGYSLKMPGIISIFFPGLVKLFNLGFPLSKLNYASFASSPMVCVLSSRNDEPVTWLDIGRLAERLMLGFNAKGVKTSVFVAALEMGDLYKPAQAILGNDQRPQFLFCAGYMNEEQKHTPRELVEKRLIS